MLTFAIGGGKTMHLKPVFSSLDSYLIAKEIIATWEKKVPNYLQKILKLEN